MVDTVCRPIICHQNLHPVTDSAVIEILGELESGYYPLLAEKMEDYFITK